MEKSDLIDTDLISTQIYQACCSELCIVVKSIDISVCIDKVSVERIIEKVMNLRHPCIAGVIGVGLPSPYRGMRIVRKHIGSGSLSKIVITSPEWWTPTAKAKAVVGLLLGLRFVHSFGLLHGHLTGDNVYFTEEGMIQISDFSLHNLFNQEGDRLAETDFDDFLVDNFRPEADIHAFTRIFSEIVFGASCQRGGHAGEIPSFVSEIIKRGQCTNLKAVASCKTILNILKQNDFKIIEGVDSCEVSKFVSFIELSETLTE
jgi:serine/threonine protein kinase